MPRGRYAGHLQHVGVTSSFTEVKRRELVYDIQRYLADKAYYVYVPQWPQYVAHPPHVKGFRHHDGYGLGMRLLYTWLDK